MKPTMLLTAFVAAAVHAEGTHRSVPPLNTAGAVTNLIHEEDIADFREHDLTSMVQQQPQHHPEVYSHALQLIRAMDSAPSCNRLATATLIESCQSLEPADAESRKNLNLGLDLVKSTFAARLAVCELMGAHAAIPRPCHSMIPQRAPGPDSGLHCFLPGRRCSQGSKKDIAKHPQYKEVSQQETTECLTTLESRPQWWTSYSNARQNAISICHAARAEIEKGEYYT